MSTLKYIKENSFFLITAILAAFALWPMKLTVYFCLFWFLSAVYEAIRLKGFKFTRNLKWLVALATIYILYIIGYFLSENEKIALFIIERKVSLLLFPVGFFLFQKKFTPQQIGWIIRSFILGNLLVAIYLIAKVIPLIVRHWDLITVEGFNYAFRVQVENITGIHPTYLTILFLLSLFLVAKQQNFTGGKVMPKLDKAIRNTAYILLTIITVAMAARGPILSFFAAFAILLFYDSWKRSVLFLASSLAFIFFLVFFVPAIGNRFTELLNMNNIDPVTEQLSSAGIRYHIFDCSSDIIGKHWVSGVGIAGVQDELNNCYEGKGNSEMIELEFNTHNQYFDIWLSLGILGLLIFLIMLGYPLIHSLLAGNKEYVFFIVFFACCFLTENLLARQYGVITFAFFHAFFAHHFLFEKK